ncbi:uncharacterized protein SCHCODRAFT_01216147 [Schizophyllum commune H4-8]|uniref:uncharacterized protein n=1 Tax=Schizophyllum commune (strain H4-8 / FGSC 9210) TaxID=578458 RepID=UPI00215ED5EA|nr:uncharacterized protein SCHCODRAFT_01216147 [Schizophyllum commune H4-8]KAI5887692.1 hypothetical protein SCHCODRAFT_01216147 [Schizophyllum commune H4-8]
MTIMNSSLSSTSTTTRRRRARSSAHTVPSAPITHSPPPRTILPVAQSHLTLWALLLTCPPSVHAQYFYTNTRHELSPGAVAGIVVAAVLVVLFFLGMYLYSRRRHRRAALVLQRVNSEPPMEETQAAPRLVHFPERPQTAHSVGKGGILRSSV